MSEKACHVSCEEVRRVKLLLAAEIVQVATLRGRLATLEAEPDADRRLLATVRSQHPQGLAR